MLKYYEGKAIEARNLLAKSPRWDKEKQGYVCQHCRSIVSLWTVEKGYDCNVCGLPIN